MERQESRCVFKAIYECVLAQKFWENYFSGSQRECRDCPVSGIILRTAGKNVAFKGVNSPSNESASSLTITKPRLGFWQIWNMSFGFLGIQVGFALQNSNVSRIFQTLGAKEDELPILWLAAPVTGLLVQPVIGHLSDRTWGKTWTSPTIFFDWGDFGIDWPS